MPEGEKQEFLAAIVARKHGDELTIDVGNFRRSVPLPVMLASMDASVARFHGGALEVTFTVPAPDPKRSQARTPQ